MSRRNSEITAADRLFVVLVLLIFSFDAIARNDEKTDLHDFDNNKDSSFTRPKKANSKDLQKMFDFSTNIMENPVERKSDVYVKWTIYNEKKNIFLKAIPTLYLISKGADRYIIEYYNSVTFNGKEADGTRRVIAATIPTKKEAFPTVSEYYSPDIYSKTLFDDNLLSPFCKSNSRYYKYKTTYVSDTVSRIAFQPRLDNTQMVRGFAFIDSRTGRVISTTMKGEFDMLTFNLTANMDRNIPEMLSDDLLEVTFNFAGNRIRSNITSIFIQPSQLPEVDSSLSVEEIRPIPLTPSEQAIYDEYDSLKANMSNLKTKARKKAYEAAWDVVRSSLTSNYKKNLGENNEFSLKMSPLLNTSFFNYSHRKGFSYRFDINARYNLSDNSNIQTKSRLGYMFTKHQFYCDLPLVYTFNQKKNGSIGFTFGNGNRITNSSVRELLIKTNPDSIRFKDLNLKYYTDEYMKLTTSYDITDWFSAELSAVYHNRKAVDKDDFESVGQPTSYKTFAPSFELTFRPMGRRPGPVLTFDYERGIKGVAGSGIEYEKLEGDISWVKNFSTVSSLSMRFGSGVYTDKSKDIYFLDFNNFKENNLIGGWHDDWSGEFQLLNPAWYNISKYYLRGNLTYERPMMVVSLIPYFGKFIESEMIYANTLITDKVHPYNEYGYAFKCRFFSMGVYLSTMQWKYKSVGVRFAAEIFGRWR